MSKYKRYIAKLLVGNPESVTWETVNLFSSLIPSSLSSKINIDLYLAFLIVSNFLNIERD